MNWRGIILTGVSAAGKTTLAQALTACGAFEPVAIVTTRAPREDDPPGTFIYLTDDSFATLEQTGSLFVCAEYRGKRYGYTHEHLVAVEARGKAPILTLTPRLVTESGERLPAFLTVFLDAPDEVLDERLERRDKAPPPNEVARQRAEDRLHRGSCRRVLESLDLARSVERVLRWWQR